MKDVMTHHAIERLEQIMARLRDPEHGCPWDIKQTFASIVPHTIEEAYEVADAIAKNDPMAIQDELGDLLFQVVFYAQLGREKEWFTLASVAEGVADKLIRRHPHVFADSDIKDAEAVKEQWEAIKKQERADKNADGSVFDDIPGNLPALLQAVKIQQRCRSVGFDWNSVAPVLEKVHEEAQEVAAELAAPTVNQQAVTEEIGDLLFAVVNLARHAHVNPEDALRHANQKFMRRFRYIEQTLQAQNKSTDQASLEEMETLWQAAKQS